jgi:OmpR-family two-component system manganese-sensing response regulator
LLVTLGGLSDGGVAMERTKARILHVDDHQDTRLMMAALLQDCGYGVLTAGSVTEGLELAKEIAFDLYILDVRLPDGTGVELCQKLRALNPKIPVLYYSAYGDEADHQNALNACGDAYLKKPVCIADIQESIAKLLGGSSGEE